MTALVHVDRYGGYATPASLQWPGMAHLSGAALGRGAGPEMR